MIPGIAARRSRWAVRNVRIGGFGWWNDEKTSWVGDELTTLAKLAPEVERIEIAPTWGAGRKLVAIVPALPAMFPRLQRVKIEDVETGWLTHVTEAELGRLRKLAIVELT